MTLEPGQLLFPYRLIEKIGEGGMGVVWKAVDTTLDRTVAIKLLPDRQMLAALGAADIGERLARFDREAKLLAALNHPNIAAIYGLHTAGDLRFIAMELVAGEDLAARIATGPQPLAEALTLARQIASALAAAHDAGVIHRDLKPANIRVTPEGVIKVLDFGLAKALDPTASGDPAALALSITVTSAGTRAGVILGTAAYMSPEQARAKPVDRRTDVWAFGCVLYEMLTGRQAFGGDTVSDVLASILKAEPDYAALDGMAPLAIRRLVRRCLQKDVAKRLRDAGDIGLEIDSVLAGDPAAASTETRPGASRVPWARTAAVTAGGVLLGLVVAILAGLGGRTPPPTSAAPRRMAVVAGKGQQILEAKISRDGRFLVLRLDDGAYLRPLDSFELKRIPESERLGSWAESPDGQSILFFTVDDEIRSSGKLRRYSLVTGTTVTLRESATPLFPAAWSEDAIVAYTAGGRKLLRLAPDTGEPSDLFEVDKDHFDGGSVVHGSSIVLLDLHDGGNGYTLEGIDLATGQRRTVIANAGMGVVTATGHLLFLRQGTLIATGFDRKTLEPRGTQIPILAGVRQFSVSDDGTLAYLPIAEDADTRRLIVVDRGGEAQTLLEGKIEHARWSPDGRWIAAIHTSGLQLVDTHSRAVRKLVNEGFRFYDSVFRPDGRAVIYAAKSEDGTQSLVFEQSLDGSLPRKLFENPTLEAEVWPTGYAPDGSGLIVSRYSGDDSDLWWLPADGKEPRPLLATKASEDLARFSPDGRFVAYESNESGRQEVWVAVYRKAEGRLAEKWQISTDGGRDPVWSPDGRELYFEDLDDRLFAVAIEREGQEAGSLGFGQRTVLFELRKLNVAANGDESYDVAPSGGRFVFVQEGARGAAEVRVVLGWVGELEKVLK